MPEQPLPSPAEMSHAMLLAVLMHNGGSIEIPQVALEPDSTGTADGSFHAVELLPLPGGMVRLSVVPRPGVPEAGIEIR